MPRKPEPLGSKPFLPGLVKIDMLFLTNPGYTSGAHCIIHARWADSVNHTQAQMTSLATDLYNTIANDLMPHMSSLTTLKQITAQSLGGDGLEATQTGNTTGGISGAVYPPNVAVVLSWKAGITWRGGRPRSYTPGVPQSATVDVGSPNLVSSYSSGLATAANTMWNDINGINVAGVGVVAGFPSYYTKYQLRPVPLFFPFVGVVVHDRLATQRRRLGKEAGFGID